MRKPGERVEEVLGVVLTLVVVEALKDHQA